MNNILLNVSAKIDRLQQALLDILTNEAERLGLSLFITGAAARDLILEYGYGIHPARKTGDIDFGVAVNSWDVYLEFKALLISKHDIVQDPKRMHRLIFKDAIPADLIPYDGVEDNNNEIHWPPDGAEVMSTLGYREAYERAINMQFSDTGFVRTVDLPDLALLKIVAWEERRVLGQPRKDAQDLCLILQHYLDAGHREELYEQHMDIVEADEFDYTKASARVIGRVAGKQVSAILRRKVLAILAANLKEIDGYPLAAAMGDNADAMLGLIMTFQQGFMEGAG